MIVEAQTSQFSSSAHGGFDRGESNIDRIAGADG